MKPPTMAPPRPPSGPPRPYREIGGGLSAAAVGQVVFQRRSARLVKTHDSTIAENARATIGLRIDLPEGGRYVAIPCAAVN